MLFGVRVYPVVALKEKAKKKRWKMLKRLLKTTLPLEKN